MALSPLEEQVVHAVSEREESIVELASDLMRLDTTARDVGDPGVMPAYTRLTTKQLADLVAFVSNG